MKKKAIYYSTTIIAVVIILLIIFLKSYSNNQYKLEPIETTNWTTISNDNIPTFIYIGRDSCNECAEFKPMLEKFLIKNKIKSYYFDTSINKENTDYIVKKYNIIGIPSIIVLKNNDYYIIMDEDHQNMLEQMKLAFN